MFISLSGLLKRLNGRKDQMYMVDEFLKHYAQAKKAHEINDRETLNKFFTLYTISDKKLYAKDLKTIDEANGF